MKPRRLPVFVGLAVLALTVACGKKEGIVELKEEPYITARDADLRGGPGAEHKLVGKVKSGSKVNVVGKQGEWLLVVSQRGNPPAYIEAQAVRPLDPAFGSYVTTTETSVRSGPGRNHDVLTKIPKGMKLQVIGAEGNWLRVESKHGRPPGYVEKAHAKRVPEEKLAGADAIPD
jgi:N-acetylmuramoyl-L-alanine amidase